MAQQSARQPRGLRNNNPLNMRISGIAWKGKIPVERNTDGQFEQFESLIYGLRAALINIRTYILHYKCNTPAAIITRWAPPQDHNNTAAYIKTACRMAALSPMQMLRYAQRSQICRLVQGMIYVECAYVMDLDTIDAAYGLT